MIQSNNNLGTYLMTGAALAMPVAPVLAQTSDELKENDNKCIDEHHSIPEALPLNYQAIPFTVQNSDENLEKKTLKEYSGTRSQTVAKSDCGPERNSVIPAVKVEVTYHNGEKETVPLVVERGQFRGRAGEETANNAYVIDMHKEGVKSIKVNAPGLPKGTEMVWTGYAIKSATRDTFRTNDVFYDDEASVEELTDLVNKTQDPLRLILLGRQMNQDMEVLESLYTGITLHTGKPEEPKEDFDGNKWYFSTGANFGNLENDQVNLDGGYVSAGRKGETFFGGVRADFVESDHHTNDPRQRAMEHNVVEYKDNRTIDKFRALTVGAELGVNLGAISPYIMGGVAISGEDIQEFWEDTESRVNGNMISGSNRSELDHSTSEEPGHMYGAGFRINVGNGVSLDLNGKKFKNGQEYFGAGIEVKF